MHTLHLITRLIIGGAQENTVLTAIDQVEQHGDRVTLVTGPGLGPEGSLERKVQQSGVDLIIVPELRRNLHPWRDWKSWRHLKRLFRELAPDLIHTHSSKAGIVGRAIACKLRIPVVHTIHGAAFHFGQPKPLFLAYRAAERWAGKRTDHFISVCDAMTKQYLEAGIGRPEMYTTVASGMDVEPFLVPTRSREDVREELGFAADDVVITKVARLFPLKGHHFLVQAALRVIAQAPQTKFMLVGDGILMEPLKAQIESAGLTDHFVFTGLVPPEAVPELIHAADIVAHTSEWEGLARVLVQGLLCAKPVVSFDIDGASEVVIPDETGYLSNHGDVDALTDALVQLVKSPELRKRLGDTGRSRFTERYRHQNATRRIQQVYEQVLGRSGSG